MIVVDNNHEENREEEEEQGKVRKSPAEEMLMPLASSMARGRRVRRGPRVVVAEVAEAAAKLHGSVARLGGEATRENLLHRERGATGVDQVLCGHLA